MADRFGKLIDTKFNPEHITLDEFNAFREVQESGEYNMFDPQARLETGLSEKTYLTIIRNYDGLLEKFE
tara:strand:- start:407 stop:613 length:207 start_codon:yes stop_codon:yes gene_type:complete